ncbi:MAG TPA: hypothetical protein VJ692_04480, partial [Nitrospiraceae bacterium]|nr:hypothetical protein [Nitrospiraceae bacterium]
MLVQDGLTGYVHEVPDPGSYAEPPDLGYYGYYGEPPDLGYYGEPMEPMGEVQYDGFGNPVGLPFLAPIAALAAKALPAVAGALPGLIRNVVPAVGGLVQQAAGQVPGLLQRAMGGGAPGIAPAMAAFPPAIRPPMIAPFRPPSPLGWIRPPLPYTGLGPRRLYMRCAVWPGPRGLVPAFAAQTPAGAIAPAAAAAAAAAQQAA